MTMMIQPPDGDRYGFPKPIPDDLDQTSTSAICIFLDNNGYPVDWENPHPMINQTRFFIKKEGGSVAAPDIEDSHRHMLYRLTRLEQKMDFLMQRMDEIKK